MSVDGRSCRGCCSGVGSVTLPCVSSRSRLSNSSLRDVIPLYISGFGLQLSLNWLVLTECIDNNEVFSHFFFFEKELGAQ